MADTRSRYYTNIDIHNKSVLNLVIENVDELPTEDLYAGRTVFWNAKIWYWDGERWTTGIDIVTEWSDEPSDERVPSEKLVYDSLEAMQGEIDGLDTRVDSLEQDVDTIFDDIDEINGNIEDINGRLDGHDSAIDGIFDELDRKTSIVQAIPIWDEEESYNLWAVVIAEGTIYISQVADNQGNDPTQDDTGEYWQRAMAGSDGSAVFVIGDGTQTSFELDHGFGTYNVVAVFRFVDGDREYFHTAYSAISLSAIRVDFNVPPSENGVVAIVFNAGGSSDYPTGEGTTFVQSEESIEWSIDHRLNGLVAVQTFGTDGREIFGKITQTEGNVTVTYNVPTSGTAVLIAPPNDDVWYRQASTTWEIPHGKGRLVMVQCYDNLGNLIQGEITQNLETMNDVTITFDSEVEGYAVVL